MNVWPITSEDATVEPMSIDKEIENFLQEEREVFEERRELETPCRKEEVHSKSKKKLDSTETRQTLLEEKWKDRKKEIKIACHNINGLKTKGWKLESLLGVWRLSEVDKLSSPQVVGWEFKTHRWRNLDNHLCNL